MTPEEMDAALPSWRATPAKDAIVGFLDLVTRGREAVPVHRRLAAFDNDGTLGPEKPYTSLTAFLDSLTEGHPNRGASPVERPETLVPGLADPGTEQLVAARFNGTTVQEFEERAQEFLRTGMHPRFARPWPSLTYAPMLELVSLLRVLDFTTYVVSGSSRDFLRTMAMTAYGATREHVIGTEVEVEYRDGRLLRTDQLIQQDRGPGKPAHFWDRSGGTPLLAAGNTTGDLELLDSARFALLVDHDDAQREYAYTDEAALEAAQTRGWTTVSMRWDFATMFSEKTFVDC